MSVSGFGNPSTMTHSTGGGFQKEIMRLDEEFACWLIPPVLYLGGSATRLAYGLNALGQQETYGSGLAGFHCEALLCLEVVVVVQEGVVHRACPTITSTSSLCSPGLQHRSYIPFHLTSLLS
jgi:hypothetical protein